jgi:small subunit ribosomal protein S1
LAALSKDGHSKYPELWAFLESLRPGENLTGTVAAIERFGVFVALDQGPAHPLFAGVGFITVPELSWHRVAVLEDVVQVGQRVTCEFIQFDTWNLEARLSLRALQPDPFQEFADRVAPGAELTGPVTRIVSIGSFVRVADGIEGLVREFTEDGDHGLRVGDELAVVVSEIDRHRRTLRLCPR